MPTLYISTTSPYTRILLMIAKTQNIDLSLKFVLPWENPAELTAVNPFSQVPTLVLDDGSVITETILIIQAIAPEIYTANDGKELPAISKAFGILSQGVRAFSTERFGISGQELHPFVARSKQVLTDTLTTLPTLSADSATWGDKILLAALIWIGTRLPDVFEQLSDVNKQAVAAFANSPLMQQLNSDVLERLPANIKEL